MKKIIYVILVISVFITACTHTHSISIKGTIIDSTTSLPTANTNFVLTLIETTLNNGTQYHYYDFSTDSRGAFSKSFEAKNGEGISISFSFSGSYAGTTGGFWEYSSYNSLQDNIDAGTIYTKAP